MSTLAAYERKDMMTIVSDRAGMARRALALLVAIMDVRTATFTDPQPAEGYSAKHNRRWRYQIRDVRIDLNPVRSASASGTGTGSPMPLHSVCGHWRYYRKDTCGAPVWVDLAPGRQSCAVCGARRTFIAEHERGNSEVGKVERGAYNVKG